MFLSGYKTHIIGLVMIASGLVNIVFGADTIAGAGEPIQMIMTGLGLMGLRFAVK